MRALVVVSVLASLVSTASAETRADRHRTKRLIVVAATIGTFAISETVLKPSIAPANCRWCGSNGLDDSVRDALKWDDQTLAVDASNLTGYVLSPIGTMGLLLVASRNAEDRWTTFVDDVIAVAEASAYLQILVQTIKFTAGRERPFAHYMTAEIDPERHDHNLSFLSGHSALTFSIGVAAGAVAHRRGYALEPVIWGTSLGLAAMTAYLRIAADKHYFTDVMSGTALGIAGGLLIPRLTGSLPDEVTLVPTSNGVALGGAF